MQVDRIDGEVTPFWWRGLFALSAGQNFSSAPGKKIPYAVHILNNHSHFSLAKKIHREVVRFSKKYDKSKGHGKYGTPKANEVHICTVAKSIAQLHTLMFHSLFHCIEMQLNAKLGILEEEHPVKMQTMQKNACINIFTMQNDAKHAKQFQGSALLKKK